MTNNSSDNIRSNENTDHDAAHIRFRENNGQMETLLCFSCKRIFNASLITDIINHYANVEHDNYTSKCLYCQGKVHQYKDKNGIQYYHDCYRSQRKLDK